MNAINHQQNTLLVNNSKARVADTDKIAKTAPNWLQSSTLDAGAEFLPNTRLSTEQSTTQHNQQHKKQNEDSLTNLQSSLLSALGLSALNGLDDNAILSQIISPIGSASDTVLTNLQSSLLSSLQSGLFTNSTASGDFKISPDRQTNVLTNYTSETGVASSLIKAASAISPESSIVAKVNEFSFGSNGLDLTDGFDAVNILQHIPVLSNIYQETTGDTIDAAAKLSGGFIYGGTLGLALSVADLAIEYATGSSVSDAITNFNYSELFLSNSNEAASTSNGKLVTNKVPSFR